MKCQIERMIHYIYVLLINKITDIQFLIEHIYFIIIHIIHVGRTITYKARTFVVLHL
jgi:hypothetical protein